MTLVGAVVALDEAVTVPTAVIPTNISNVRRRFVQMCLFRNIVVVVVVVAAAVVKMNRRESDTDGGGLVGERESGQARTQTD